MEKVIHIISSNGWKGVYTWPLDWTTGKGDDPFIMRKPLVCFALVESDNQLLEDEKPTMHIAGFTHIEKGLQNCENPLNFLGYEAQGEEESEEVEELWLEKADHWQEDWQRWKWDLGTQQEYPRLLSSLFDPVHDKLYISEKHLQDLAASESGYK